MQQPILAHKNINVVIKTLYCLNGEYIPFPDNPLNNAKFNNVDVTVTNNIRNYCGIQVRVQTIEISGQEPIDCEYVSSSCYQGTLYINICEDWG